MLCASKPRMANLQTPLTKNKNTTEIFQKVIIWYFLLFNIEYDGLYVIIL